jgi:hypothetical protein
MLEIKGKIIAVLEQEKGTSAKGEWVKQTAVLQYGEKYPKKVPFEMWKDNIVPLQIGQDVTLVFDIDGREWNGKWFTTVNAYKVVVSGQAQLPPPVAVPPIGSGLPPSDINGSGSEMPF